MRTKVFNIAVILTSFIGYLEWGEGSSMFLIQGEIEIFTKLFTDPGALLHPFVLLPLAGQVLLLLTLFQEEPRPWMTYVGIGLIAILLLFIFVIGILGSHFKVSLSIVPFIIMATLAIRNRIKPGSV